MALTNKKKGIELLKTKNLFVEVKLCVYVYVAFLVPYEHSLLSKIQNPNQKKGLWHN